jgi:hypothetical protein
VVRIPPLQPLVDSDLTCSAEISIAEESDKNDDHERRGKELASGKKERCREHQ